MILFVNPRATRPANRRFPLSLMSVGAALPAGRSWEIVDGNKPGADTFAEVAAHVDRRAGTADAVSAIAMTVMPGPQLVAAVPLAKLLKARFPSLPIIWGGYFPSLYPKPVLRSSYVNWIVRGQGERTFAELLDVIDGKRDPKSVAGLGFRDGEALHIGAERMWEGPNDLPAPAYDKIDVADYLRPTFLGSRSGVYQASIGCPYSCSFCGVISVFGSREKMEAPARTAAHLEFLVREHGMNGVHFYDNNFFVKEDHALELCDRIEVLDLSWWCEARIDALLRFSDATLRRIRRAGLRMVFLGAESGSDSVLQKMSKKLTTAQTLEVARRTRQHDIIPEFSFVLGDPDDAEHEIENTLAFVRKLKAINPDMELITYFYTPTPQRRETYGNVDPVSGTPEQLDDWVHPEWVSWMTHEDPQVAWMNDRLKARVKDFELVLKSRFPSLHDVRTHRWGKELARVLAMPRWRQARYGNPRLLRAIRKWAHAQDDTQAYGHLRPATGSVR